MKPLLNFLLAVLIAVISNNLSQAQQVRDSILPINETNWVNYDCGNVTLIGDTLRVYGSDYRIGGNLFFKGFFNFQNDAEVYVKWRYHSPSWEAVRINIDGVPNHELNTTMVSQDIWYYTHVKINSQNQNIDLIISTDNYDDESGQVVYHWTDGINNKRWKNLKSTTVYAAFVDNYSGTNAYLDIAEVKLLNIIPVNNDSEIINTDIYDFENGQMPQIIHTLDTNNWLIDQNFGFSSSSSLYSEAPENVSHSAYMDLEHLVKIEFDVFTTSNTHKTIFFSIDSIASIPFNKGSSGCWKHVVWRFNDDLPHRIFWRINGTPYDNSPGKIWIDNLEISYRQASNIQNNVNNRINIYPNPADQYLHIEIPQNEIFNYKIIDNTGRQVQSGEIKKSGEIGLINLKNGIYLLILTNQNNHKRQMRKLIIDK